MARWDVDENSGTEKVEWPANLKRGRFEDMLRHEDLMNKGKESALKAYEEEKAKCQHPEREKFMNGHDRCVVVNWLFDKNKVIGATSRSVSMTVIMFDRLLAVPTLQVSCRKIQGFAISCLSRAMTEREDPVDKLTLNVLRELTIYAYSLEEICAMMEDVVYSFYDVKSEIVIVGPFHWLDRFAKAAVRGELNEIKKSVEEKVLSVATCAIELQLISKSTLK